MADETAPVVASDELLYLTSSIVASFVANNSISYESLPDLIRNIHATMTDISGGNSKPAIKQKPAVAISKSVTDDHLICLEDGNKVTMLKRYLRSRYDMSPDDYRSKWGLPADYPMVAPNYSKRRSEMAKKIGLGRGGKAAKKEKK